MNLGRGGTSSACASLDCRNSDTESQKKKPIVNLNAIDATSIQSNELVPDGRFAAELEERYPKTTTARMTKKFVWCAKVTNTQERQQIAEN